MFDLPPPTPGLLEECPQFESLYKKLSLSFLDQNGTIKSEVSSTDKVENELRIAQAGLLRETLLQQSLQSLISSEYLPQELQMMIAQQFLEDEDLEELIGDSETGLPKRQVKTDTKIIEAALRQHLSQQLKSLKSLTNDPPTLSLSETCRQRAQNITKSQENLTQSQLSLVTTTTQILDTANAVIKLLRTCLDMNRHGQSERTVKLFTEYLTAISKGLEAKLEATSSTLQTTLYTPEILALLHRIKSETASIQENLVSRREYLEKSLERYSSAGPEYEKIVKEYLRTHVSILRCEEEIEELKGRGRR